MNIIFDLDGTLIDVSKRHHYVYSTLVKKFGGVPLTKEAYWNLKMNRASWSNVLNQSKVNESLTKEFLEEFIDLIEQPKILQIDHLLPHTLDTLQALAGHDKYLVTLRRHQSRLYNQLEQLGIKKYFKKIVVGHAEKDAHKAKSEIIRRLIGSEPAIVVGDTEADVGAAKLLGLKSAAVYTGIRTEKYLKSLQPDYLLGGVNDLPPLLSR